MIGPRKNTSRLGILKAPVDVDDVQLLENSFDDPTLLTIVEVAEFLKISTATVRRLQQQRKIPFFKVRGGIRFLKEDVLLYLVKQRVGTME